MIGRITHSGPMQRCDPCGDVRRLVCMSAARSNGSTEDDWGRREGWLASIRREETTNNDADFGER